MQDITYLINLYRNHARTIWNDFFLKRSDESPLSFEEFELFWKLEWHLFQRFVLREIGNSFHRNPAEYPYKEAIPFICIVPRYESMRVFIQNPRKGDSTGYWDHPIQEVLNGEIKLLFIDFFDWDQAEFRDYCYIRGRIAEFPRHPELEGRDLLVESNEMLCLCTQNTEKVGPLVDS